MSKNSEANRAAIVYVSEHHGNTAKVAETLGQALQADVLTVDQVAPDTLAPYGLVGFGSGIFYARHHASLRLLVDALTTVPRRVFLFSTAGLPVFAGLYHLSLRRKLIRRGCSVVGEFSCRGWDTFGPLVLIGGINRHRPNARDLRHASEFAVHLRAE